MALETKKGQVDGPMQMLRALAKLSNEDANMDMQFLVRKLSTDVIIQVLR
jgi:hypothetical protein